MKEFLLFLEWVNFQVSFISRIHYFHVQSTLDFVSLDKGKILGVPEYHGQLFSCPSHRFLSAHTENRNTKIYFPTKFHTPTFLWLSSQRSMFCWTTLNRWGYLFLNVEQSFSYWLHWKRKRKVTDVIVWWKDAEVYCKRCLACITFLILFYFSNSIWKLLTR